MSTTTGPDAKMGSNLVAFESGLFDLLRIVSRVIITIIFIVISNLILASSMSQSRLHVTTLG
eukprot:6088929-Amphidinium_carterae.1